MFCDMTLVVFSRHCCCGLEHHRCKQQRNMYALKAASFTASSGESHIDAPVEQLAPVLCGAARNSCCRHTVPEQQVGNLNPAGKQVS